MPPLEQLRRDALEIWWAAVQAVQADQLILESVHVDGHWLRIQDGTQFDLRAIERIVVVGAGKAGAAMAVGLEKALSSTLLAEKHVRGLVNVPEGTLVPTTHVHLHAARPAELNEPTEAGVAGSERVLDLIGRLTLKDLCIVLISGGGSALLPAPVPGISLEDKIAVTRFLSGAGATIEVLNAVRSRLSRVKGGGLARACKAGKLVALIVSDVLGDPLESIASGPTVEPTSTSQDAIAILDRFGGRTEPFAEPIYRHLEAAEAHRPQSREVDTSVHNFVIGNNALAVDRAGAAAERLGYAHAMVSEARPEGMAEDVGRHLARMALQMRTGKGPNCLISGGEPVVKLARPDLRGKGGRNQQLALAALQELWDDGAQGIVLLSGGTDGEDGPTDAAGAIVDAEVIRRAKALKLNPGEYLAANNAYAFFQEVDSLLITGPTGTNVCDVRVVLTDQAASS